MSRVSELSVPRFRADPVVLPMHGGCLRPLRFTSFSLSSGLVPRAFRRTVPGSSRGAQRLHKLPSHISPFPPIPAGARHVSLPSTERGDAGPGVAPLGKALILCFPFPQELLLNTRRRRPRQCCRATQEATCNRFCHTAGDLARWRR